VEAISKSRYWKESAIFVTEDDSQDRLDPSTATGPSARDQSLHAARRGRQQLPHDREHARTIKQILGLPPLNQFDLAAEADVQHLHEPARFQTVCGAAEHHPARRDESIVGRPTGAAAGSGEVFASIDSSEPDSASADILNRAIWHSVKGFDTPYNYGRPITRTGVPVLSLSRLAGF
jgi:hypothetical protein